LASLLEEKGKPNGRIAPRCHRRRMLRPAIHHGPGGGPCNRDILIQASDVRVVVDPKSALFVSGSVLDYSDDLQKGGFKVTNRTLSRIARAAKVSLFKYNRLISVHLNLRGRRVRRS